MKFSNTLQLLLGLALLVAFAFTPPSQAGERAHPALGLAEVTGMAFQEPVTGEPQPLPLICKPSTGARCTPSPAIPFSHCQTTILPIILGSGCGPAVVNKWCGYKTDDPEKNDVCTTDGAEPGNTCSLSATTGVCVEVREGRCRSVSVGSFFQCKCSYSGYKNHDGRKVCTAGSTGA